MEMKPWTVFGFLAQACFFMRFLVQWIESEKRKQSIVPVSFWYWSLLGASGTLIYAIHVRDPVFIVGQSTGWVIYIRNLVMIRRRSKIESPDC